MNEAKTKVLCEKVMGWTVATPNSNSDMRFVKGVGIPFHVDFTTSADCDALVEAFVREYGISFSLVEHKTGIVDGSYIQMIHCNSSHVVHTKMTTISGAYTTSAKNIAVCEAIYSAVTGGEG